MDQILKILLAIITLIISTCSKGNAQFINAGTIDYVKTTNLHLSMKVEFADEMGEGEWMERMMKMIPKNATKLYTLTFNEDKSFFCYLKDGPEKVPAFGGKDPASENIVIKDYKKNQYQAQKDIFDQTLLVVDTIPQYKWKIHDEIRQIAGYNCRKATTVVGDSMVVVAFYCDEIMLSSGPESFGGLPGMILGLAIPRLYSTWFATQVKIGAYDPSIEKPFSKKVKNVTLKSQIEILADRMKDWGKYGEQIIYKIII